MGRRLTGLGALALTLGLVLAMVLSQERQLSIRLWLAAAVAWGAWSLVSTVLKQLPPPQPSINVRLWRRRRSQSGADGRPSSLQSLQGTILASRDSGRAYALRLRPRLAALADHQLALRHGIDRARQPERVTALLGPRASLINDRTEAAKPTLQEIDELLDLLDIADPDAPEAPSS